VTEGNEDEAEIDEQKGSGGEETLGHWIAVERMLFP
jgi:hypothetical protein